MSSQFFAHGNKSVGTLPRLNDEKIPTLLFSFLLKLSSFLLYHLCDDRQDKQNFKACHNISMSEQMSISSWQFIIIAFQSLIANS